VALPDIAVESFREYLTDRGLNPEISSNDPAAPLIAHVSRNEPLSASRIYEVLARAFERCAADVHVSDPRAATRIRQASTHWLRHTHGSHAAARGVPQDVLQANLGHESLATTSIYVRAERGRRHRAVQQAFGSDRPPEPLT
jgi:site-specific recombinase XerD